MKDRGFTLIELLVVIAIIGILSTIGIASFTGAQARGRDAARKSDLAQMKRALEMAKNDSPGASFYPNDAVLASCGIAWPTDGTYIKKVPCDPKTGAAYTYAGNSAGTAGGTGNYTSMWTSYTLKATLENTTDPVAGASGAVGASATRCGVSGAVAGAYYVCPD